MELVRELPRTSVSDPRFPKILFWFSTRTADYNPGWGSLSELFGAYPHLVDADMIAQVQGSCDHYVACTSKRGLPQV